MLFPACGEEGARSGRSTRGTGDPGPGRIKRGVTAEGEPSGQFARTVCQEEWLIRVNAGGCFCYLYVRIRNKRLSGQWACAPRSESPLHMALPAEIPLLSDPRDDAKSNSCAERSRLYTSWAGHSVWAVSLGSGTNTASLAAAVDTRWRHPSTDLPARPPR